MTTPTIKQAFEYALLARAARVGCNNRRALHHV